MKRAEASNKAVMPSQTIEGLQRVLEFEKWPLKELFIPGFSPKTVLTSSIAGYTLEHETLLPVNASWVGRRYFYSQPESRSALALTVIVGQQSAKDAAQGLVLQLFYTEMHSEPHVNFSAPPFGDVTIYRDPQSKQTIAFIRNNVGISIDNYSSGRKPLDLERIAKEVDLRLQGSKTVPALGDHPDSPRITRFEPKSQTVHPGERTDLEIEVKDNHPPLQYQFQVENGSYNLDPKQNDRWYFRAGPAKGEAELTLTIVNEINLMAVRQLSITIA